MKAIVTILGVVLLIIAAMYFLVPAELAPEFLSRPRDWSDADPRQARHVVGRSRRAAAGNKLVSRAAVIAAD